MSLTQSITNSLHHQLHKRATNFFNKLFHIDIIVAVWFVIKFFRNHCVWYSSFAIYLSRKTVTCSGGMIALFTANKIHIWKQNLMHEGIVRLFLYHRRDSKETQEKNSFQQQISFQRNRWMCQCFLFIKKYSVWYMTRL